MTGHSSDAVMLTIGTRNGVYFLDGDATRTSWNLRGPFLTGMDVSHAILDERDGKTVYAATNSNGEAAVYRSDDLGETWQRAGDPFAAEVAWHVEPANPADPDAVYAGVAPAALYRSSDRGATWSEVTGLTDHPSHSEWQGGGGGLCLHTIVTDPDDAARLSVGISSVGWFATEDGGKSWETRNTGINSFFDMFAEEMGIELHHRDIHNCVHKAVLSRANGLMYQQNHDGVYKSFDNGREWIDISEGLPTRFGFVIGDTADGNIYVVPQNDWEEPHGVRYTGQLAVYRLPGGEGAWERLTTGLPEVANMTLYREGMATDWLTPGGIYFGTSDGVIFASTDGGDTWHSITNDLPSVRSVSCGRPAR